MSETKSPVELRAWVDRALTSFDDADYLIEPLTAWYPTITDEATSVAASRVIAACVDLRAALCELHSALHPPVPKCSEWFPWGIAGVHQHCEKDAGHIGRHLARAEGNAILTWGGDTSPSGTPDQPKGGE